MRWGWGKSKIVFTSIAWLCFALSSRAELLLSDFFDYTNGPIAISSVGKWITHSGTPNEINIVSGRVELSGSNSEDVNALLAGQPYDSTNATNRFYASFTVRFTSLPSAAGNYFAHFKGTSATAFAGRIWAFTAGATSGKFRLGISSANGAAISATNPTELSLNADYLVVTRLVSSNSVTKLWINPAAESDPSIASTETAAAFTLTAYAFREATGEGSLSIDNLRVGTAFVDVVTNALPQQAPMILVPPQNRAAFEGSNTTFSVVASATPAPSFQWLFNGTNLPGATSSTLTLTNVSFEQSGFYSVSISNALDVAASDSVVLNVFTTNASAFTLLTYNLHGNGVLNWSTNTAHVQAIGRQVKYLDPDIMTFQEVPVTNNGTAQMENFVAAFRPGFHLVTNSTDDLFIRSVIISRFPITASRSWLHGTSLQPFGYSGSGFTRDLFEAEIAVPNFPQPLHVFTVHLKSGQDSDSAAKRAAEAGAISNFLVTAYLTSNSLCPYVLTGDMNEDLQRPPASNPQSIERLISDPTGLRLATPFNPSNRSELTFSIQSANGLTRRYDYILPCALLSSNAVSGQVFRTDLLNPIPSNLLSDDDQTASDHLPVLMVFANPYTRPFRVSIWNSNQTMRLSWPTVPGQLYRLETSTNLIQWNLLETKFIATNQSLSISNNSLKSCEFFRVKRGP